MSNSDVFDDMFDDKVDLDFDDDFAGAATGPVRNAERNEAKRRARGYDDEGFIDTHAEPISDEAVGLAQTASGDRSVPRISIVAFCERPETAAMIEAASVDRRLAKTNVAVERGGLTQAVQYFSEQPSPNLIVVESLSPGGRLLRELEQLAQLVDPTVKVIVLGAQNDILLYRELMRRGVSDYLVPPLQPVQLIRSIANLYVDPDQPFTGKSIAVVGVKGGVGSSTIAHNLAWAIAEHTQINAVLVDLDLTFGTTGLDFNQEPAQTIADALMAPDRVDDAILDRLLTKATERLSLLPAPATVDRTYDFELEAYEIIIQRVRQTVPLTVLDLPHVWTDWMRSTVITADEIVLVAAPELASLRNAKNLIDFLKAARPNDALPKLVLNMTGVPKRPEIPVKEFGAAVGIEPCLVLPFEPQLFGTALNNGQMLAEVAPQSRCAEGMDFLAKLLTGREIQTVKESLLSKVLKFKK
jgi:pilus assembly protein CpaE